MYFKYKAADQQGKIMHNYLEAGTEKEALKILKGLQLNIIELQETKSIRQEKVRADDLVLFTRLFSRLLQSHIPVLQSLNIIRENMKSGPFRAMISSIMAYIEKGESLSKALSRYPRVFSGFYCGIIRAGENSGKLNLLFELLFKYLKNADTARKKIRTALLYPVFVLVTAMVILSLIFVFVVPQFRTLFSMFDADLPLLTQAIFSFSVFIKNNFFILLAMTGLAGAGVYYLLRTEKGRKWLDKKILVCPLLGELMKEMIYARFSRVFAILVQSNINILAILDIMKDVITNTFVRGLLEQMKKEIKSGKSITAAMSGTSFFPASIVQMVKAGEESGELDKMLLSAAEFYEENLDVKIEVFTSMLQPVLIILIGAFIALIIIAVFLPVFQLSSLIR